MIYRNLHMLICESRSSREYFLSLPVPLQMLLHEQGNSIRSASELRLRADMIRKLIHTMEASRYFENRN